MNWFCADHADDMVFANDHLLANQMPLINTADDFKLIETLFIIMDNHEADFIHVGIEQNAQWLFARAFCFLCQGTQFSDGTLYDFPVAFEPEWLPPATTGGVKPRAAREAFFS